jgi:hypothetical protein
MNIRNPALFNIRYSLYIIHFSLLIIFLTSCQTTTTKSGSLSGNVILNNDTGNSALDPIDYAGVTVALYHPAVLDPTIVNINTNFPNIGVQITQQTEFDHRLQNPAKVTTTSADGSFSISKINPGKYNLFVMKEGWGVRYLYDINIAEGDNTLNSDNSSPFSLHYSLNNKNPQFKQSVVELFPVTELSGYVNNSFEFKTNHNYIITEDATFTANVKLSPLSYIWIAPGKKISFYSEIASSSNGNDFVRISSSDEMYTTTSVNNAAIQKFYSIECNTYTSFVLSKLSSILTTYSTMGWRIQTSSIIVENMIFRDNEVGIQCDQVYDVTIQDCNLISSSNVDMGCCSFTNSSNTQVENSIAKDCKIAIKQNYVSNASVDNCYFDNNTIKDIYNLFETIGNVTHCVFSNSKLAISTAGECNTTIEFCDINGINGIINEYSNFGSSYFTANFNNYNCTQYCVQTRALNNPGDDLIYYNFENNYWGTVIISEIESKIWDRNDEDVNDPYYNRYRAIIDYTPIRTSRVPNTGIVANRY